MIESDASQKFGSAVILLLALYIAHDKDQSIIYLNAYISRKLNLTLQRYSAQGYELPYEILALKHWRHLI